MEVDYNTALEVFNRLPDECKDPYFHPYYVLCDAARDPALEPVFFIYQDGGEMFYHAFHLGKVEGTHYHDIQSPYAYGGPLASTGDSGFLSAAWQNYLSWCRHNHILAEFVRFHPRLENWRYFPGETQYMRKTVLVDLQADLFRTYSPRVRTAIRKAMKNRLRVEWVNASHCCQAFVDHYTRAMELLQADQFYIFPHEYFQKLLQWQQSHLAFCLQGEEILAAALFLKESHIMEYHLAAASTEGKKWGASNLLLYHAAMKAREMGCRILHLGGGTDNRPDNPLLFFKSGFSPQRSSFMIGNVIHAPEAYKEMQRAWQDRYGKCGKKTLFYRFPNDQ